MAINVPIKEEFQDSVKMIQRLLDKYINELQRADDCYCGAESKVRRTTRKSKLSSYRKLINDELMEIERDYKGGIYDYEYVEVEKNGE